jgi:hypothetical protein
MKRLGRACVCFGMFLVVCGDHAENPSAGANPSSHQLSKNYGSTKQLNLSNRRSQSIYDESWSLDESDIRELSLSLAAQPMDPENTQSGAQESLVGTWIALAVVADALVERSDCAASANSDHQRRIDPKLVKGSCVEPGAQP